MPLRNKLLGLFCLAFALRLGFIAIYPAPDYYDGISSSYFEVATNILEGKGAVILADTARLDSPERQWVYEPFIERPLGYALFIALPLAISSDPLGIQIMQSLLAGWSVLLLFGLTRRLCTETTALTAAILYAVWPLSIRFEITTLPDAVMSFYLLLTVWLLVRGLAGAPRWELIAGITAGIGLTMRPDIVLLPLFLTPLFFVIKASRPSLRAAFFLAGFLTIVGLHTVRNYQASRGEIVPLGLGNGISLWEGISQFGDTLGTVYGDQRMAHLEGYPSWAYPDGIQRDRRRFREALAIIAEHPVWYAGVMVKRIPVLLTPDWIMTRRFAPSLKEHLDASPDHSVFSYIARHPIPSLIRALLIGLQWITLALAFLPFFKRPGRTTLLFPLTIIFYYIIVHIPTNTEARYFYPAVPFVLMLASYGWSILQEEKLSRARQRDHSGVQ